MYSAEITQKRLHQATKAGLRFNRLSRDVSIETAARLQKLRYDLKGELIPDGGTIRPLDSKELSFTASERILCKADFEYYATRYHWCGIDTGTTNGEETIGPVPFQPSQKKFLNTISKREEEVHAEYAKYQMTDGIRVIAHKTRQVYFTDFSVKALTHRMLFWPGTRAFGGALNPDGAGEMYKRYKLAYDNLPFWLKPDIYPGGADVKDTELVFPAPLNTRLLIQAENQKAGIAVGTQQDASHLSEVPLWVFPEYNIGFSLMAAIPKSRSTIHIQEGTSSGKGGYWQTVSEDARHKRKGYEGWSYIFIPSWLNVKKYRMIPPSGWVPDKHTIAYAELVERTSPEWNDGVTFRPGIEHLAWWEHERAKYVKNGALASFLASYPCTPEQSFVTWGKGALPVELIESMQMDTRFPSTYSVEVAI